MMLSIFRNNVLNKNAFKNVIIVSLSTEKKVLNDAGSFYHDMMFRRRNKRLLPIRDLKTLFKFCTGPEHAKYAVLGVELYQENGQDYSEEISALFVKTCIACQQPMQAVDMFLKINRRIAAWQTVASVKRLVDSVREVEPNVHTTKLVNLLGVLQYKGVTVHVDTIKDVAKDASNVNDPILNKRMYKIINDGCDSETASALFETFSNIAENRAALTGGKIDSGNDIVVEETGSEEERVENKEA